ncbi:MULTISPECIES: hypothetical protein [unclassified Granulicatella]|uniref:hypothetical protein n=1 Tax=unclassified Granulicatella TaxID=2630493 RepID=UPI001073F939|nr:MULTISPECIES: hypothetical protein [unclassified Granulicatella]MBF0780404.1 hypothetical protein [Granulicatella sp. 19428wC4_WM01]TFU95443.1 hypothetical protein E4T68_04795 [Granulicatella sp. WM01]
MLKQAFRFLGIGFFLSGCLLLGLSYSGYLTTTQHSSPLKTETTTTTTTTSKQDTQVSSTQSTTSASVQVETTQSSTSQSTGESISLVITEGDDSYTIAEKLHEQGIISSTNEFINYLVEHKLDTTVQNGTFTIPKHSTFEQLGKILTTYPGN